jgi:Fic family protein
MAEWKILTAPPIDLSTYFKRRQDEYYRLLLAVSREAAWSDWVSYFLRGLADQAGEAFARAQRLVAIRRAYRRLLRDQKLPASANKLVDRMFIAPYFTVRQAAKRLEVTDRTARLQVQRLEKLGVIREITGMKKNRIYLAEEIFAAINDPIPNAEQMPPMSGNQSDPAVASPIR